MNAKAKREGARGARAAVLGLADGTVFRGEHFGAAGAAIGEVVFNTSCTGYQEIITDASYHEQIVAFTFPHIGNVGANPLDNESERARASGVVVRSLSLCASSWRAEQSLEGFLEGLGVPGISGIDTRQLTRRLRSAGALSGCILPGGDAGEAVRLARDFPGMAGSKLAPAVSAKRAAEPRDGLWDARADAYAPGKAAPGAPLAVVLDCGVKSNIPRMLAARGLRVCVLPYSASVDDILARKPGGVLVSNGPGDPSACGEMVATIGELVRRKVPVFGICLGAQMLALAAGCTTEKMKFGHHGSNHPVCDTASGRVAITSQNHGFAVSPEGLPANVRVTHRSLFDGSIQGIELADAPAFAFQGHPEASPGPHDIAGLFDRFAAMLGAGA